MFHCSCQNGNFNIFSYLWERRADIDINLRDSKGVC